MPTCWHEGNRAGAKLQMLEWLTLALPAAFESKAVFVLRATYFLIHRSELKI